MVKAQYVVITVQVDMSLIVVCERIMKVQPAKMIESDDDDDDEQIIRFGRELVLIVDGIYHLLHCFPDVNSLVEQE